MVMVRVRVRFRFRVKVMDNVRVQLGLGLGLGLGLTKNDSRSLKKDDSCTLLKKIVLCVCTTSDKTWFCVFGRHRIIQIR